MLVGNGALEVVASDARTKCVGAQAWGGQIAVVRCADRTRTKRTGELKVKYRRRPMARAESPLSVLLKCCGKLGRRSRRRLTNPFYRFMFWPGADADCPGYLNATNDPEQTSRCNSISGL